MPQIMLEKQGVTKFVLIQRVFGIEFTREENLIWRTLTVAPDGEVQEDLFIRCFIHSFLQRLACCCHHWRIVVVVRAVIRSIVVRSFFIPGCIIAVCALAYI